MAIKGIPSTYNKDLQESVEPMIENVKTLKDSLLIATRVLDTLTVFPDKMLAALTPDMLATDLAEYLVRKGKYLPVFESFEVDIDHCTGLPFRETHRISGLVVALGEEEKTPMDKLTLEQLQGVDRRFEKDVLDVFDYEHSVEMKTALGGTSRSSIMEQIAFLRENIDKAVAQLTN